MPQSLYDALNRLAAALPESRGPETPLSMASLLPVVAQ